VSKRGDTPKASGTGITNSEMLGLSVYLALAVVIPLLLGWWLGGIAGAPTVGVVAGVALGIVAAGWTLYLRLRRYW
jgi:F0F1-type ATP synthase assembly protein I